MQRKLNNKQLKEKAFVKKCLESGEYFLYEEYEFKTPFFSFDKEPILKEK